MSDFMPKWVAEIWTWTRENDLPNWISVAFASFIWPVALVIWSRRKVNGVEGLQVRMGRGNITIGSAHHDAVAIEFINNTGSVVYITGASLKACPPAFPVPIDARINIVDQTHRLLFMNEDGQYLRRELTLQTNDAAHTAIAVSAPMPERFYTFRPTWFRRKIRSPTYFVIEFTAMVGTIRHRVATIY